MSYASQVSIPPAHQQQHLQARDLTHDDFPALNGHAIAPAAGGAGAAGNGVGLASSLLPPPPGLSSTTTSSSSMNAIGGELRGMTNGRNMSYSVQDDKQRAAVAKAFASSAPAPSATAAMSSLPPLPGQSSAGFGSASGASPAPSAASLSALAQSRHLQHPQLQQHQQPLPASAIQDQQLLMLQQQQQQQQQQHPQSAATQAQTPIQQVLFSPADRYGLLGLLHLIRHADPDSSMLALGHDLTELGLDLAASDNLHSTFVSPFAPSQAAAALHIEPEFHLPSCYNVQPPPAASKISNFSDETLFFIFYSQPRDAMQEMAAQELYKHNWRYHKDLRLWLTKEAGSEPTMKTDRYEKGSYIFFDPSMWERVRKDFVLVFDSLERRM